MHQAHHIQMPVHPAYSCFHPNNCHAIAYWNTLGNPNTHEIDGIATSLSMPLLTCSNIATGNCSSNIDQQHLTGLHGNDSVWLLEQGNFSASQCAGTSGLCWTEIGDSTWWTGSYVLEVYYRADSRPCGGGFNVNYAYASNYDVGYNEQMVIQTRTGAGSHICGGNWQNSTVYTYIQSHANGNGGTVNTTYSPIIPNTYEMGIELQGGCCESAGAADFTGNDYTPDNAQTWLWLNGIADNWHFDYPPSASWQAIPSDANQGGDLRTWCC